MGNSNPVYRVIRNSDSLPGYFSKPAGDYPYKTLQELMIAGICYGFLSITFPDWIGCLDTVMFVETNADFAANYTILSMIDPHDTNILSVTSPTRALNTVYQPSVTSPVMVYVDTKIVAALTLTTGADGKVDLVCDTASTPTTVRGTVENGSTGTLVVGLNTQAVTTGQMSFLVPAGWYYSLKTTNVTGAPTITLPSGAVTEMVL